MYVCLSRMDSKTTGSIDLNGLQLIFIFCKMVIEKKGKNRKMASIIPLLNILSLLIIRSLEILF